MDLWESGTFIEVELDSSEVIELIDTLTDSHVNGGALIRCFIVSDNTVFKIPIMVDDYKPYFERLLTSPDIKQSLHELRIGERFAEETYFKSTSPFIFEGEMADVLFHGGAYREFDGTPRQAKDMAQRFSQYVFGDRFMDIVIYTSHDVWCDWFLGIAWDTTWLIFDKALHKLWIICVTDTD